MPADTEGNTGRAGREEYGADAASGPSDAPDERVPEQGTRLPSGVSAGATDAEVYEQHMEHVKREQERERGQRAAGDGAGDEDELVVQDPVSVVGEDGTARRTTRRFPLFTKDTARPEGGGRAASGDAPAPARQWPVLAVLSVVALGLLLTALDVSRAGTLLVGVALLGGAVMRWVLPDVGMLAVRSRFTDTVTYGLLGLVIVLLALMMQPHALLEIPFLQNTLHYTIQD